VTSIYLALTQGTGFADVHSMVKDHANTHPLRLLLSYWYFKDANLDELVALFKGRPLDLFADSGAYSAFTAGGKVSVEDYAAWVCRWHKYFTVVSAPDVIGDAKQSLLDTEKMLKLVPSSVTVLPVFHVGEDWSALQTCCDLSPYIALGGMVPHSHTLHLRGWLTQCFAKIPRAHRVHGFGMTNLNLLRAYPWASADSSSWTAGFRYGIFSLYDPKRRTIFTVHVNKPASLLRAASVLRYYGASASTLSDRAQMISLCVRSWQAIEDSLDKRVYLVALPRRVGSAVPNSLPALARVGATPAAPHIFLGIAGSTSNASAPSQSKALGDADEVP